MRDLTSRLREIVRRESTSSTPAGPIHELTYEPEIGTDGPAPRNAAEHLGGVAVDAAGACVLVEHRYSLDYRHGHGAVAGYQPAAGAPLGLFDPRLADVPDWARRLVFFDIETTGLSGGAGTIAFLVGCGWFDASGFVVRQFFMAGPSGERPMLSALGEALGDASLLVTYNGRTFDVPFMETRWAFHRSAAPTDDVPHFDMLPAARRLWRRHRDAPAFGDEGCSLTALERRVLGFHRHGDVPGFEIPARYFHFLRSGDASAVLDVIEHNRLDLVSLAAVMAHALRLAEAGPDACREPGEQLGLGRLYERDGRMEAAVEAYRLAAEGGDRNVAANALERAAILLRRQRRFNEAAEAWQAIVDLRPAGRRVWSAVERRAIEALAIHHEHRRGDPAEARRYAHTLDRAGGTGRSGDVARRLQRLERKLAEGS